jgi:hypothetical protein
MVGEGSIILIVIGRGRRRIVAVVYRLPLLRRCLLLVPIAIGIFRIIIRVLIGILHLNRWVGIIRITAIRIAISIGIAIPIRISVAITPGISESYSQTKAPAPATITPTAIISSTIIAAASVISPSAAIIAMSPIIPAGTPITGTAVPAGL